MNRRYGQPITLRRALTAGVSRAVIVALFPAFYLTSHELVWTLTR